MKAISKYKYVVILPVILLVGIGIGLLASKVPQTTSIPNANCKIISPLVSTELAARVQKAADDYVRAKVGDTFFNDHYACGFIGYDYYLPKFGTALYNYLNPSLTSPTNYSYKMLYVSYDVEISADFDASIPTLDRIYYHTESDVRQVKLFGDDVEYTLGASDLYAVFDPITLNSNLSVQNFPDQKTFNTVKLTEQEAIQKAKQLKALNVKPTITFADKERNNDYATLFWNPDTSRFAWRTNVNNTDGGTDQYLIYGDTGEQLVY